MKNIKDITLSIFAIIGFVAILSSFNNQSQTNQYDKIQLSAVANSYGFGYFILNKETGDVTYYNCMVGKCSKKSSYSAKVDIE